MSTVMCPSVHVCRLQCVHSVQSAAGCAEANRGWTTAALQDTANNNLYNQRHDNVAVLRYRDIYREWIDYPRHFLLAGAF